MCQNDFGIKVVLYDLGWPFTFLKSLGFKQNTSERKIILKFWDDLLWPLMTYVVTYFFLENILQQSLVFRCESHKLPEHLKRRNI